MIFSKYLRKIAQQLNGLSENILDPRITSFFQTLTTDFDSKVNLILEQLLANPEIIRELKTSKIKDNQKRKEILLREFPEEFIQFFKMNFLIKYPNLSLNILKDKNDINYKFLRNALIPILKVPENIDLIIDRYNSLINQKTLQDKSWKLLKIDEETEPLDIEEKEIEPAKEAIEK